MPELLNKFDVMRIINSDCGARMDGGADNATD